MYQLIQREGASILVFNVDKTEHIEGNLQGISLFGAKYSYKHDVIKNEGLPNQRLDLRVFTELK